MLLAVRPAALWEASRAAGSIPLLERALAGRERVLGPDDPAAQRSRDNLAAAWTALGCRLPRTGAGSNVAHGARAADTRQVMLARHRRLRPS